MVELKDCKCKRCVGACESKPGWFLPGEAEKAAELLGMELEQFFKEKLMVDWWGNWRGARGTAKPRKVFVLSPALVDEEPGTDAPGDPRGKCVFLKRGRCQIHAAKPHECRQHIHDEADGVADKRKREITKAWAVNQKQIRSLLGRKPEANEWSGGGLFGMFGLW